TRWPRDWSSDVCSSDLLQPENMPPQPKGANRNFGINVQKATGSEWKHRRFRRKRSGVNSNRVVARCATQRFPVAQVSKPAVSPKIGRASCRERVDSMKV